MVRISIISQMCGFTCLSYRVLSGPQKRMVSPLFYCRKLKGVNAENPVKSRRVFLILLIL